MSNKNVFIHCYAGVSRSATFVVYYIMKTMGLNVNDAMAYVKKRRSKIKPNSGFYAALSQ
jgi:protein-tyrosine phosphatase